MPSIAQRVQHIIADRYGAAIVEQTIEKAVQAAKERATAPQTAFYDPLSLFMGREWIAKQGFGPLELRAMANNPIIGSIIGTRINQIAAFCVPRTTEYGIGYEITAVDPQASGDNATKNALRDWVYNAGSTGFGEDLFENFARKFMRDSLVLDQACAEIVLRRNQLPAYIVAVDAAQIRKLKASLNFASPTAPDEPYYAQVMNDVIVTTYTKNQMMFGIRNPQTDINLAGYGQSELETLVRVITTLLNTEKYNSGQLTAGGTAKGILVVKGDADATQFAIFKQDFRRAIANAAQNWTPPVLKVSKDADVSWETLDRSNKDMEFAQLYEFLVKQACGIYQIDPSEINWNMSGGAGTQVHFEGSQGQKQQLSQNRGLKPLLNFLANQMNVNLISRIDPRYRLEFLGVDKDRQADAEVIGKEVTSFRTLNEARKERGWVELEGGDVVLNELYLKARDQARSMKEETNGTPALAEVDPNELVDIQQDLDQ